MESMARHAIDNPAAFGKEMSKQKADNQTYHKTERIETRFGQQVRCYRMQRHFTQEELAFLCGLHQNYISEIEAGKRNVTLRVMESIAKALGVKETDLF